MFIWILIWITCCRQSLYLWRADYLIYNLNSGQRHEQNSKQLMISGNVWAFLSDMTRRMYIELSDKGWSKSRKFNGYKDLRTTRRRWKTKKYKNDRSKTSRPVSALSQIHIDESLHFTYVILHISRDYWKIGRDKWLLKSKTTEQESTTSFTNWFSYEEDRN